MNANATSSRVLMVDDDANLLNSYRRTLKPHYDIQTAQGGKAGLTLLEAQDPFAVIVSDIKMPDMTGIEFLKQVKALYPDTIRMVLTGYADLEIAINSVNQGDIFRFLTKPCGTEDMIRAIDAGLAQYNMAWAARELAIVRRLKAGLEGALKAFTRLVEFRDPYTAGHMDRTAAVSTRIAQALGLDANSIEGLRQAAMVHDIGKIAVPAGILNKPGSLSKAEFALIQAHPLVGAEVFKTIETQWPVARMILEHHERLDGSGYPYGLFDKQLLPESKILQVADVIDAVMTNRPYRSGMTAEETIGLLRKNQGRKLDGDCCEAAVDLLENSPDFKELFP